MVLFAVLWQYVKVLLGKHGLERCDVGGQWGGSSLCLFTVPGSFHEMLGGRSCGSEVGLSELWEEACKKQLVSKLPIRVVHSWGRFFKLQLFLEQGCGSVVTRSEGSEFSPLLVGLFLLLGVSSFTPKWTMGHFDFSLFPVNLGVVVLEPVVA